MDKLKMRTANIVDENIKKIGELFPNVITEVVKNYDRNGNPMVEYAIDFDMLRQELSEEIVEGIEERYQFTWPDKKKSTLLANAPINLTLRPCREESVDFDNTENLYIEGDNLDVLKLLKETYHNKIKMIYIDPPYNTGKNYIYKNDFISNIGEYVTLSGQLDDRGNQLVPNLETNGQFHTDWLNMIYPRLKIAKQLLTDDGVLVVTIDENEQAGLSLILKEIFREGGYEHVCVTIVHNPGGTQGNNFSYTHEYAIFVFPKGKRIIQLQNRVDNPDIRPLRDVSKGNHLRENAKNCFYAIYVKENNIIGFGDVCDDAYHPESVNVIRNDGIIEIYPIDTNGNERKWVWARHTVETIKDELRVIYNKNRGIYDIERVKTHFNYKTVWIDDRYNSNSYGSKLLAKLMPNCGFNFPKSLYTVLDCIKASTLNDPDAIVLDFFSGSATTAHAVMQLNSEDGGKRKFIMIQLPEDLDEALVKATGVAKISTQQSIKFLDSINKNHFLTEIGKERIRRAGKKIKEDNKDKAGIVDLDIGFRVLKLDSSNMKDVYYTTEEYAEMKFDLKGFEDNIKEDRTDEDLLLQIMLELGIPLSAKIKKIDNIFYVDDNYLIACFDKVDTDLITEIAKAKPYYAVFRDSSFIDDSSLINFEQIFNTYSPQTIRKVL